MTIVEANTVAFREAKAFLDENEIWKGKRFQQYLPKRMAVANGQGNQSLILDLTDESIKLALTGIVSELLEKFDD